MTLYLVIALITLVLIALILTWLFYSSLAVLYHRLYALESQLQARQHDRDEEEWEREREALDKRFEKQKVGQRSKISGTILEKYCPFSPEYTYDPRDVVAIFDAFDFLVLRGKSQGQIEEIVFQEMKGSLSAPLNLTQRQLRDCVNGGVIRFETWKLDTSTGKWHCK